MAITSASLVNRRIRGPASVRAMADIVKAKIEVITAVDMRPLRTRSGLFAPRFCPTKVDNAAAKFMAGMAAKESMRNTTEYAATEFVPKGFTSQYITIMLRATNDCCKPMGSPMRIFALNNSLSKTIFRHERLMISWVLFRYMIADINAIPCAAMVAKAAPSIPHPNPTTKRKSRPMFMIVATIMK